MNTFERYKDAGVNIDSGNLAVNLMKPAVRATFTPNVLADVGSFGGLYALTHLPTEPVLVASTDGVGTKVTLAAELGRWNSIGHDIVNHCVNDILVQNARPLFFLDYIASSRLDPRQVAMVVGGVAEACKASGCALLGGETAEMPGVYVEGGFDLAGTVVGLVDRRNLLPLPELMQPGNMLVGLPSSGPHTNGYSLIRHAIKSHNLKLDMHIEENATLGDALLQPHRCYRQEIDILQNSRSGGVGLLGMAHITGGGFIDNIPRVLPQHLAAEIEPSSWEIPPLFSNLVRWSDIGFKEAYRVWNMGIGMVLVIAESWIKDVLDLLPDAVRIGRLIPRKDGYPSVQLA